jgi:putative lipoprotein (rSAM/lipoprotein system)
LYSIQTLLALCGTILYPIQTLPAGFLAIHINNVSLPAVCSTIHINNVSLPAASGAIHFNDFFSKKDGGERWRMGENPPSHLRAFAFMQGRAPAAVFFGKILNAELCAHGNYVIFANEQIKYEHMKNLHKHLLKSINVAIAGILACLGFAGCGDNAEEAIPMYACPRDMYNIKGNVVDKETQAPVVGIEVKVMMDSVQDVSTGGNWIWKTGAQGSFFLFDTPPSYSGTPGGIHIVATDIDGTANGAYRADTIYVDQKNVEHTFVGDGRNTGNVYTATVKMELEKDIISLENNIK